MVLVCGIDEAGRGPVIGPLVIAGVVLDENEFHKLQQIGVKDSKLLSPSTRERLFDQIKAIAPQHHIISLSCSHTATWSCLKSLLNIPYVGAENLQPLLFCGLWTF